MRGLLSLIENLRRQRLHAGGATIDLDGTDVECYGTRKDGIVYSYNPQTPQLAQASGPAPPHRGVSGGSAPEQTW
jgi:hypothetical protein